MPGGSWKHGTDLSHLRIVERGAVMGCLPLSLEENLASELCTCMMMLMKIKTLKCISREKAVLTRAASLPQAVPARAPAAGEAEPQSPGSAGAAAAGAVRPGSG